MKRIASLFIHAMHVMVLSLSSCGYNHIPTLYANFKHISFNLNKSEKKEWERIAVNDDFSYINDFVHPSDGKADYFVRVFYKGNQIFEERKSVAYMPSKAFVVFDTLYFVYGMFDDEQLISVTTYCLKVDKNGQSSVFTLPGDTSCRGACTDGEYCYFLLWERQNNVTKLIKTNLNGEIIYQEPSSNDYSGLYSDGTNLYTQSYIFSYDDESSSFAETKVYKWQENRDNIAIEVYSIPGFVERLAVGDKINALSYIKKGDSYAFYKTEENESKKVCEFITPNDLGYNYKGAEQIKDGIIIGFDAYKKGNPKDLYSKAVFLYSESPFDEILSFCPTENVYSIIFRNGNVFYGSYVDSYTDGTKDGSFNKISI